MARTGRCWPGLWRPSLASCCSRSPATIWPTRPSTGSTCPGQPAAGPSGAVGRRELTVIGLAAAGAVALGSRAALALAGSWR